MNAGVEYLVVAMPGGKRHVVLEFWPFCGRALFHDKYRVVGRYKHRWSALHAATCGVCLKYGHSPREKAHARRPLTGGITS